MWMVVFGGAAGLAMGSFLATVAVRWPEGRTLGGRSACDHCGKTLGLSALFPLVSWMALRGRTACCGQPIRTLYPAFELTAALIGAMTFALLPPVQAMAGALLGWALLLLFVLDARHFWLPDAVTLPLLGAGLVLGTGSFATRLSGAVVAGAALLLVAAIYRQARHREGLGGGDIKLGAALGAWLGVQALPVLLLAASASGIILALLQYVFGRHVTRQTAIPFGACLALAGWPLWLWQEMALV